MVRTAEEIFTAPCVCSLGAVSIVSPTLEHLVSLWATGLDRKEFFFPANSLFPGDQIRSQVNLTFVISSPCSFWPSRGLTSLHLTPILS